MNPILLEELVKIRCREQLKEAEYQRFASQSKQKPSGIISLIQHILAGIGKQKTVPAGTPRTEQDPSCYPASPVSL